MSRLSNPRNLFKTHFEPFHEVTQSVKKKWADWVTPKICLKCVSSHFRGVTQSVKKKWADWVTPKTCLKHILSNFIGSLNLLRKIEQIEWSLKFVYQVFLVILHVRTVTQFHIGLSTQSDLFLLTDWVLNLTIFSYQIEYSIRSIFLNRLSDP